MQSQDYPQIRYKNVDSKVLCEQQNIDFEKKTPVLKCDKSHQ